MTLRKLHPWALITLAAAFVCLAVMCSRVEAAVEILSQPGNIEARIGQSVTITVTAESTRSIRYYWYKNGTMLSIKTKTITMSNISEKHAATYDCLVTDGKSSKRCTPFTLKVTKGGIITLSWSHPDSRANGNPLPVSEIAGYELFKVVNGAYVFIDALPANQSHTVSGLMPGTYEFALTVIDSAGLKSSMSPRVRVTVK